MLAQAQAVSFDPGTIALISSIVVPVWGYAVWSVKTMLDDLREQRNKADARGDRLEKLLFESMAVARGGVEAAKSSRGQ